MLPSATLTSLTATGDVVVGPGDPKYIVNGLPIYCIGDAVAGAACTGSITVTTSKFISLGRPASTIASVVVGVNPIIGVPMTTAIAMSVGMNEIR